MSSRAKQFTLATASADISSANWVEIEYPWNEGPSGDKSMGPQAVGFRAVSTATGAAATIMVAFWRSDGVTAGLGVQEIWTGTVTVTARRQELANTGGAGSGYLCNIVWDKSGTHYVDTSAMGQDGTTTIDNRLRMSVGMTAAGGLDDLEMECWPTRNA